MTSSLTIIIRRIAALVAILAALSTAGLASDAKALNPEQTAVVPTVNIVYWDLDRFWIPLHRPTVGYYNYAANGAIYHYWASCAWTGHHVGTQGFYCAAQYDISLDWSQQHGNLRRFGDGAVAFWVAHEYAHHVETLLQISLAEPHQELLADCFAGMYFRHGIYTSKKLNLRDRQEARNQIWALAASHSHGTRQQRLNAFDFGFQQTTWRACLNGAGRSY